jgi:quercetin dioxygenase-like cupin family protein
MDTVTLAQRRTFSPEKLTKVPLFDSGHMFFDLYCLLPGQSQRAHVHDASDKIYVVLEGEAMVQVGNERELVPEGTAVIARAGQQHGVSNESDEQVVLLVAMAPRPA